MTAPIGSMGGFSGPSVSGPGGSPGLRLDIAGEQGAASVPPPLGGSSFSDVLSRALDQASAAQDTASDYVQRFVSGQPVELHQVMAAAEEAQLSVEMLVELRNKLTDAYKAVMNLG